MEAKWSAHHEAGELAEPEPAQADDLPGAVRRPTLRSRLAHGTVPVEEQHQVLVSAALVAEHEAAERALDLRVLPPARFRRPVRLDQRALLLSSSPPPPARARAALALFSAALALTSVAIASWNAYWLAEPLREAIGTFIG